MSNEEKKRIEEYKKKRIKLIYIQIGIIILLAIISASFFMLHNNFNKTYSVKYYETADVNYRVYLTDNSIFDDDYIGEELNPVSSLIDYIQADFRYKLNIDSDNVNYKYSYEAYANLIIFDKTTNGPIYERKDILNEGVLTESNLNELSVSVPLNIDFNKYNSEVIDFVRTLNLQGVTSKLSVNVVFKVYSNCEGFENNSNQLLITLNIPLNENIIDISKSGSIPTANEKYIVCNSGANQKAYLIVAVAALVLDVIAGIILIIFTYITRDTHINYEIKIKKIVNSYKSFIQKINNSFDTREYQVLLVNSINEMLEIRDTLQSPILMSQNDDNTMTQFIIPTNNKIVYIYEVKVDNYDELYSKDISEQVENDTVIIDDIVIESEPIIISEEDIPQEDGSVFDGLDSLQYSFEAKLVLSKDEIKGFYKEIIKYIKQYGIKVSRSFKRERIYKGKKLFATLVYRGKTLCILFPIDSNNPDFAKYKLIDMSQYKKYSNTPSLMKITSSRKVKYVIQILEKLFISNNIENKNLDVKNENIKTRSKGSLIKEGLIKKINRN